MTNENVKFGFTMFDMFSQVSLNLFISLDKHHKSRDKKLFGTLE